MTEALGVSILGVLTSQGVGVDKKRGGCDFGGGIRYFYALSLSVSIGASAVLPE